MENKLYERIRERREELNMSQAELAQILGYKSRSTIAKIEAGENDITQSKIIAFAKALKTTPSYLMGLDEKEPTTMAAHLPEGVELTEKEEKDIRDYIKFILSKRNEDLKNKE